ncbi:hypothetical protein QQS45_11340 [Alteriqipengyuania flavescens]|nr:hypothetical protein [Alteriqipengyuania flavescens]WJY18209.1 hypothetical protein QQW98_11335 [Alteriqipengyuania flavescens]WJY24150.1 hypothetical protein QQS45_11340 [Alteriqipengyuania flavescens]
MIIGALPFSFVVSLMAISVLKAIVWDVRRKAQGVPVTSDACAEGAD